VRSERALDVFVGVSVWSWGASILLHEEGPPRSVRIAVAILNACVGTLFILRSPAVAHGRGASLAAAIPSIVIGGVALKLAPPVWPLGCEIAFGIATALALGSLAALGRSFAILPARRAIVARGPYRIVRHPAYASELAMLIAAGAARSPLWAALLAGLGVVALVPRILAEEALLAGDPAFAEYARKVRHRLVPGIW
jgi:protein-S-isoprenylcysteine O-methyltransferase Ste14